MDGERWEEEGRERGGEVEERRQRRSRRRHADTFLLFGFVGHPGRWEREGDGGVELEPSSSSFPELGDLAKKTARLFSTSCQECQLLSLLDEKKDLPKKIRAFSSSETSSRRSDSIRHLQLFPSRPAFALFFAQPPPPPPKNSTQPTYLPTHPSFQTLTVMGLASKMAAAGGPPPPAQGGGSYSQPPPQQQQQQYGAPPPAQGAPPDYGAPSVPNGRPGSYQ